MLYHYQYTHMALYSYYIKYTYDVLSVVCRRVAGMGLVFVSVGLIRVLLSPF